MPFAVAALLSSWFEWQLLLLVVAMLVLGSAALLPQRLAAVAVAFYTSAFWLSTSSKSRRVVALRPDAAGFLVHFPVLYSTAASAPVPTSLCHLQTLLEDFASALVCIAVVLSASAGSVATVLLAADLGWSPDLPVQGCSWRRRLDEGLITMLRDVW